MAGSSMGRDAYLEKISAERKRFIFDMANDEWVDRLDDASKKDDAKFNALFKQMYQQRVTFLATLSTPTLELHCFADHWNWGGGLEADSVGGSGDEHGFTSHGFLGHCGLAS
jgi:hypothetical protein